MKVLLSIAVGILTAAFGCLGAGCIAQLCVTWYRISAFEGGSGYFVVFLALLGLAVGFLVGIVASAIVFGTNPASATFLRAFGAAMASTTALLLITAAGAWLAADKSPTKDGMPLVLAIEVRCPKGLPPLTTLPTYPGGAFATLYVPGGSSHLSQNLRLDEAKEVDGQWIIPATVPLDTSAPTKQIRAYIDEDDTMTFPLPFRAHPEKNDFEWSAWIESTGEAQKAEATLKARFQARYRVQTVQ